MRATKYSGFTAVELLVTIVVGVIFIGATTQMYSVVINDAAKSRNKANASMRAYTEARATLARQGATCTPSTVSVNLTSTGLPVTSTGYVTRTTTVVCPYSAAPYTNTVPTNYSIMKPNVTRVTVRVDYGNPVVRVHHVLYK